MKPRPITVGVVFALLFCCAAPGLAGNLDNGGIHYSQTCTACHGANGEGVTGPSLVSCGRCGDYGTLQEFISDYMPQGNPTQCQNSCSWDAATYVYEDLNGHPTAGYEVYIPHITGGLSDWTDLLEVDNKSPSDQIYTITLYNQGAQVYDSTHTATAERYEAQNLKQLANAATCGRVNTLDENLHFRVSYEYTPTGGVAAFDLSQNRGASAHFFFANQAAMVEWKGIAVMNTRPYETQVTLTAIGSGAALGNSTQTIAGFSRLSGVHSAWFPGATLAQVERIVAASSSGKLTGISISGKNDGSKMLFSSADTE